MAKSYKPELGQAVFGNPTREFECPSFIEAGLEYLAVEIERVERNITQNPYEAPTGNVAGEYKTDVFEMRSYCWGCECGDNHKPDCSATLPNFRCRDLEIAWYKYCGRGMSMNRDIDANEFFQLIDECLESVRKREKEELTKKGMWFGE